MPLLFPSPIQEAFSQKEPQDVGFCNTQTVPKTREQGWHLLGKVRAIMDSWEQNHWFMHQSPVADSWEIGST